MKQKAFFIVFKDFTICLIVEKEAITYCEG